MKNAQYLTKNLYSTANASEIIDFLVDHQAMPKNLQQNHVVSMFDGDDFVLVLFIQSEKQEKFMLFRFENFAVCKAEMMKLSNIFNGLIASEEDTHSYKKAKRILDETIYMLPTYRAIYGYKVDENLLFDADEKQVAL
ncbi:MAG: hypothetical protein ACK4LB_09965 [Spirosomataceae bacterium]